MHLFLASPLGLTTSSCHMHCSTCCHSSSGLVLLKCAGLTPACAVSCCVACERHTFATNILVIAYMETVRKAGIPSCSYGRLWLSVRTAWLGPSWFCGVWRLDAMWNLFVVWLLDVLFLAAKAWVFERTRLLSVRLLACLGVCKVLLTFVWCLPSGLGAWALSSRTCST